MHLLPSLLLFWSLNGHATQLKVSNAQARLAEKVVTQVLNESESALKILKQALPDGLSSIEIEQRLGWNTNRNLRSLRHALALGFKSSWSTTPKWQIEFAGNPQLQLDSDLPFEVQRLEPLSPDERQAANEVILRFWDGDPKNQTGAIDQFIQELRSALARESELKTKKFVEIKKNPTGSRSILRPLFVDESLGQNASLLLDQLNASRRLSSAEARVNAAFAISDALWLDHRFRAWQQFQVENRIRLWALLFANRSLAFLDKAQYQRSDLDCQLPNIIKTAIGDIEKFINQLTETRIRLQTAMGISRFDSLVGQLDSEAILEEYSHLIDFILVEDPSLRAAGEDWKGRRARKDALLFLFDSSINLAMAAPLLMFFAPETFLVASGAGLARAASSIFFIGIFQAAGKNLDARIKRDKIIRMSKAAWLMQLTAEDDFNSHEIFDAETRLLESQETDILKIRAAQAEVKRSNLLLGSLLAPAFIRPKLLLKFVRDLKP